MSILDTSSGADRLADAPAASPAEIQALVAARLVAVERRFREELQSPVRIANEIGDFVGQAGGKRVRPTLHLLAAELCGYRGPHDVLLGCVLEFIHSATLVHDDVIDESSLRRGRPSVNSRWGNHVTVLFGDYLYARAMQMALQAGSLPVMRSLADVTLRMVEGELLQTRQTGRVDLTADEYLDLVERKTAGLFACCCELAGILAGIPEDRMEALRRYGLNLGIAFQIVDDLLDLTGEESKLGKPAGLDLREGKVTLAVIDWLDGRGSDEHRGLVRRAVAGESAAFHTLRGRLEADGALLRARRRAEHYAAAARLELERFEDSAARRALMALPDLVVQRDR